MDINENSEDEQIVVSDVSQIAQQGRTTVSHKRHKLARVLRRLRKKFVVCLRKTIKSVRKGCRYIRAYVKNAYASLRERFLGLERKVQICVLIGAVGVLALLITFVVRACTTPKELEMSVHRLIEVEMVPVDIPLSEKEDMVYEALIKEGYTPQGACGIMGNIAVESSNFDPTVIGGENVAYGLFQWTDVGGRRDKLRNWCKENGYGYDTIDGQVAFAIYELRGADPIASRVDYMLRNTDDTYSAAAEFAVGFERCISDSPNKSDKYYGSLFPEFYGNTYQALSKRINKAMNYELRYVTDEELYIEVQ